MLSGELVRRCPANRSDVVWRTGPVLSGEQLLLDLYRFRNHREKNPMVSGLEPGRKRQRRADGTYSVDNTTIAIGGGICGIKGPWTDQTIIASQLLVQRAFLSVSDTQCELSSQTYSLKIWPAVDLGNTDKVKIKFPGNTFPPLNSNVL